MEADERKTMSEQIPVQILESFEAPRPRAAKIKNKSSDNLIHTRSFTGLFRTAAWKLLGKALAEAGDGPGAATAYAQGIAVAEARGDVQAAKEMRVFLRRLEKSAGGGARED